MTHNTQKKLDDDSNYLFDDLFFSCQLLELKSNALRELLSLNELQREEVTDACANHQVLELYIFNDG